MKNIILNQILTIPLAIACLPGAAWAQLTDGEIRNVDQAAKKLTIRHGPIVNVDMPAMTMVFQVKDAAMIDKVNVGDRVKFHVEKIPGGLLVTEIDAVK